MAGLLLALMPGFDLSFSVPQAGSGLDFWWGVSFSASKYGLVFTALSMLLVMRLPWKTVPGLLLPLLVLIGVGAWLNEHVIKPAIAEPRPSILFLASAEAGPVIDTGVANFYALPDKPSRSRYLEARFESVDEPALPPLLREHWIAETGYSFPSGHAFAAAALAGWFMLLILCSGRRYGLLPLLWGWVLAVCYSRILLGVHRPQDVFAGVVEGGLLALAAFYLQRMMMRRAG